MKMKKYKLIIFDMDGTLADTSVGIIQCHKYTNVKMGRPEPTDKELENIIGGPLLKTYKTRFGFGDNEAVEAVRIYREHYAEYGVKNVLPYSGMNETLSELKKNGYMLAVATLKAERFAKQILEILNISKYFDIVHGVDENDKLSKADLIRLCINETGINYSESVLVGDSINDEQGAKNAGVDFIAVTYGFGFKENVDVPDDAVFSVSSPKELSDKLCKL